MKAEKTESLKSFKYEGPTFENTPIEVSKSLENTDPRYKVDKGWEIHLSLLFFGEVTVNQVP